ncbi:MAG: HAMP domain-containing histidine kinase [Deltaproteobacteria bacterium]|nr:HAMP domain-containing histidine kinase [Deltaproteobacteria bacterium]
MSAPDRERAFSWTLISVSVGVVLPVIGVVAFNLGSLALYSAFFPLLCLGLLLFVDMGEDVFLSLLFLTVANTLLYGVGLFALPLITGAIVLTAPLAKGLRRWGMVTVPETVWRDARPLLRVFDLAAILLVALSARYAIFRLAGGHLPLRMDNVETLSRFVMSEVGGWSIFALGYGAQHRLRYGIQYSASVELAASLPALLATGLFLVTPHVVIMTLGLNAFGISGLYVALLPVGAAHVLVRTLTTRRRTMERQNERLQQMNLDLARNERLAAIGQMSSAISHQILQKVGLLGLQCDLLREVLQEEGATPTAVVTEAQGRVEQLDHTLNDLNRTLSDLLVFSRDFELHCEPCELDHLVSEVVEELRAAAIARRVVIAYRCEGTVVPLAVDRIKLKQALFNLLKNAVEASPAMGEVVVTLGASDQRVTIAMQDHGQGIGAADFPRLFSPFFSTKEKGTGLGLTFAQKIVELHNGQIVVSNNPDAGASFRVELPAHQERET